MPALSEYTNVYNTAINIMQQKGYHVWYDEKMECFWAEKNGWDFVGDSPCGLLGVVAIYEFKQPSEYKEYWWKDAGNLDHNKLPRSAPKYIPVARRHSDQ